MGMRNKKVVEINNFNNFNNGSSNIKTKLFYNYVLGENLTNTRGVVSAKFPKNTTDKTEKELNITAAGITNIQGITYFEQYSSSLGKSVHRLLVYASDKKVYINQLVDDMYDLYWLYSLTFDSAPQTLCYKHDDEDYMLLTSDNLMKVWRAGYSPYTIENVPIVTSMCACDGYIFCTIKDPAFKIWYTKEFDAEKVGNISSVSNYISLEDDLGDAKKVITFNEQIFVFREYGITKIEIVKKEVFVSQIYLSNTRIHINTVNICGNNVLFVTNDGIYSFNGLKVNKVELDLIDQLNINCENAVASSLADKYYIALKVNFEDNKTVLDEEDSLNNVLLIVDINDFNYQFIRGVDIKQMLPVKNKYFEKMLAIFNTGPVNIIGEIVSDSKFMENNLPKFWLSENLIDGANTKLLTKLNVYADAGVKICLKSEEKDYCFTTYNKGLNEFAFKIMAKDVSLEISSSEESAIVKNVMLEYYEY